MDELNRYNLELAKRLLEEGDEFRATQIVLENRNKAKENSQLQYEWGKLCEELGLAIQAKECYKRALRFSPSDISTLIRLSSLLYETGYYEDAIHYLNKILKFDSENADARKLLGEIYHILGFDGQAEALIGREEKPPSFIRYFPPTIGSEDIRVFKELFSGREVGYAIQKLNPTSARSEFEYINLPLSDDTIKEHIEGKKMIVGFPLRSDNTVRYLAIGIAIKRGVIQSNVKNTGYLTYLSELAFNDMINLKNMLENFNIPSYIDGCGDYSFRLWIFFNEFVHFLKVKRLYKLIIEDLVLTENKYYVKPISLTKGVGIGWVESGIPLPLGKSPITNRRYMFLERFEEPFEEQLRLLKRIITVPFKLAIKNLKKELKTKVSEPKRYSYFIDTLLDKCPVLKEIVKNAEKGMLLPYPQKVILFYTIGILDSTRVHIHRILEPCPDYNFHKVERQLYRLKPNPISCVKIRELVPEITSTLMCNCIFDLKEGRYPSPLLHIRPELVPIREEMIIEDDLTLREAAKRYIILKKQAEEIEKAISKLETILNRYFTKKGIYSYSIMNKAIKRKDKDEIIVEDN